MAGEMPVVTLDLAPENEAERQRYLHAAREQERSRLAQWIHDDPMQELIGLRFQLSALAAQVQCADLDADFESLQMTLQETIQSLRTVCSDLRPPALAPFGLEQALRAYSQSIQERRPELAVDLSWRPASGDPAPHAPESNDDGDGVANWRYDAQLALFRIVQAALENVVAHAGATQAIIRLECVPAEIVNMEPAGQMVRLTVADDGCGFNCPQDWLQFARAGGYGLLRAQECTCLLGGTLRVVTAPDAGTQVILHAPTPLPAHPAE